MTLEEVLKRLRQEGDPKHALALEKLGVKPRASYGVPPANSEVAGGPPLQAGKTYTVSITRKDEKGTGDGFTNTRQRYVGTNTFVAVE